MTTLLKIQSSLSGDASQSAQLADRYARGWLARHPDGRVVVRDLARDPVTHLTAERFAAFASQPDARTPAQQAIVAESDVLVGELRAADVVLLAVPMHNFGVPSTLRAYFDHVARAGVTFRYSTQGPEGLLTGKRAVVVVTRGGFYPQGADLQVPYLRQFLGFVGIADVEVVLAEGLAVSEQSREQGLERARLAIDALATKVAAWVPTAGTAAAAATGTLATRSAAA